MNMKRLTLLAISVVLVSFNVAVAAESPSLEKGKQLFESKKLGTSGKSCSTCHTDGQKLKGVKNSDDKELAETVNRCISGPLKGKPLDQNSSDMKSLLLYLRSLAGTGK